jgi:hypothetical protein
MITREGKMEKGETAKKRINLAILILRPLPLLSLVLNF